MRLLTFTFSEETLKRLEEVSGSEIGGNRNLEDAINFLIDKVLPRVPTKGGRDDDSD